jgi:hypothetical protein
MRRRQMANSYMIVDGENVTLVFDQSVVRCSKSDLDSAMYSKIVDRVFSEHSVKLAHSGESVERENLKESLEKTPKMKIVQVSNPSIVSTGQGIQEGVEFKFEVPSDTSLYRCKSGSFCADDYTPPGAEDPGFTIGPGQYLDVTEVNTPSVKRAIRARVLVPTTVEECESIRNKYNQNRSEDAKRSRKGVSRDSGLTMEVAGNSRELLNKSQESSNTISLDVDSSDNSKDSEDYSQMFEDDGELVNF